MTTKMTLRKSKEDDLMLEKLKLVTGVKTKAPALLKVGHSYLVLLKKHEALERKYSDLKAENEKMKQAINERSHYYRQLKEHEDYLNDLAK